MVRLLTVFHPQRSSLLLQALAYLATGNEQYARNAVDIVDAWATTNKVFGVVWENGPLEAGWFVASVLKGLELLKYTWPDYSTYKVGEPADCVVCVLADDGCAFA
jgi:hypothetical protein